MTRSSVIIFLILSFCAEVGAQKLPDKIRGYKVHEIKVRATNSQTTEKSVTLELEQPSIVDIGLTGATLEAKASLSGLDHNADVDSLMFRDITANGIVLDIADYEHPFKLKKGEVVTLPLPVRGTVSTLNMAKAAYNEATDARAEWRITGTVFVFARFKKLGFTFKRVIPVPIDLTIPNPLRTVPAH